MKKLLLLFCLLCVFGAQAQSWRIPLPLDSATSQVVYTGVIQAPAVSKDELYNRARRWIATEFKSASSNLQMDDRQAGTLMTKGATTVRYTVGRYSTAPLISFTISIEAKDGRYRYKIRDLKNEVPAVTINGTYVPARSVPIEEMFSSKFNYKKGEPTPSFVAMMDALDAEMKRISKSLQEAIADKGKDW